MTNPMAAAYGSYAGFPGGFGGFPATMGDWSQFAAAAAAGGASGGGGVGGVATSGDYQIGNYSQLSSNYGPTSRVNSRSVIGADKNNRGMLKVSMVMCLLLLTLDFVLKFLHLP
ncbi:hypothetical protein OS493_016198 [Desmophyllum pertusum]|uniref:Uncharacterized protein n=1 Tax=Desmophyllum pertusum TaxID=174260 RepID=A0A9X0D944_9CNID|nr:hypothetical protein OS493_016198 [Desmophyllum pertusum]